jgi:hypothetical protein
MGSRMRESERDGYDLALLIMSPVPWIARQHVRRIDWRRCPSLLGSGYETRC